MKAQKRVLIIIEESSSLKKIAQRIATRLAPFRVDVVEGSQFVATDLLPADAYFLGCDSPQPISFAELERVLQGINLAGRTCGLFTSSAMSERATSAIEYLRSIIRDTDLRVNPDPFFGQTNSNGPMVDERLWIEKTLRRS